MEPEPTEPIYVDDPDDPRLEDFRTLTDPALRKRYEAERGVFIVESALAVEKLAVSPHAPATRSLLVGAKKLARLRPIIDALAAHGATVYTAEADVLEATAGFPLHRGVVASVNRPDPLDPASLAADTSTLLGVEGVNDHENLGSLFRGAAAFGVDGLWLDPTCADPWYRRCVRVSMGHALLVPHARVAEAWPERLSALVDDGWRVLALTPSATVRLNEVEPPAAAEKVAILVGAEGPGLAADTITARGVEPVRIAMAEGVDSVNVATAAAIALAHLRGPTLN